MYYITKLLSYKIMLTISDSYFLFYLSYTSQYEFNTCTKITITYCPLRDISVSYLRRLIVLFGREPATVMFFESHLCGPKHFTLEKVSCTNHAACILKLTYLHCLLLLDGFCCLPCTLLAKKQSTKQSYHTTVAAHASFSCSNMWR